MIHDLKILDSYYDDITDGMKCFEVRFNDRNYKVGDRIQFLSEHGGGYRQHELYEITYIHSGLGMDKGYVILGLNLDI